MSRVVPDKTSLVAVGQEAGLLAVGFTSAAPFPASQGDLEERKRRGLSADMAFTYRNPARSCAITTTYPWARSIIVGAWPYPATSATSAGPSEPGALGAYVWERHYDALRSALGAIAASLHTLGFRTQIVADDNALMDRAAAVRAGVGWWGKNTNVLLPGYGSWFVLGSVITDAEIEPDARLEASCGSCRRCLDGCPTGALIEPGVLDARRCLAWLVQSAQEFPIELRPALGGRVYGCDDCQLVCPPNRHPETAGDDAEVSADLDVLLEGSDEEILARYGTWYIPRRQVRYVRRNALIAWANTVDGADPAIDARLARFLAHDDLMLVAYAIWATRRLGRDQLLDTVDVDFRADGDAAWRERLNRELRHDVATRDERWAPRS